MTKSSGSSQCDPELAIPDIFWDMETNPSYQAIGSERQIFSMSVVPESGSSRITKVSQTFYLFFYCHYIICKAHFQII